MATISPTQVDCPKETHTSKGGFLRLTITSIADSDATTNQRTIGTKVTIQGESWVQLYAWSVKLGGKVITENISTSGSIYDWRTGHVLATKTLTFDNDSAGNLTVQAYVKQLFYYGMGDPARWNNSSYYQLKTADLVCSQLPRYTSFSTHVVDNTTLNTATIKWSAPDTVDKQEYSLDGGTWTSFTGNSYTLTGLSPGSTHKVKTRIRRQDSQLTTTSGELSFTLKSLPTSNTPSNINLGSKQTVSISSVSYLSKWICEIYDGSTKIKEDTNITTTSKEIDISASTIVSGMLGRHKTDNEWNLTYKFKVVSNGTTYNLTDRTAKIIIPAGQYAPTYNISSVSYKVTDSTSNNITGSNQKVIKGISDVQFTIGAATPNGSAAMSRYIVSTGDKSVSVNSASSMSASISDVSSKSFSVQAIDGRGRSTTVSKDYSTYIDYFKPTVTNYSIARQDAVKANLIFNITGKFCNWSGLQVANTISSVKYQYKLKTASSYSSEIACTGITISGDSFTVSCAGTGDLINISNEYDIKINIYDKLSSTSFTVSIGTGKALLWRDLANTRIGIGKKPTKALDVNGDVNFDGNIYVNNKLLSTYPKSTNSTLGCTGRTTYYYHICHIKKLKHEQGAMYGIRVYEGYGNNGGSNQNTYTEIVFQDGWVGSADGRPGVTCEFHNLVAGCQMRDVKVTYSDKNNYDVWLKGIGDYTRPNFIPMYNPELVEITNTSVEGAEEVPAATGNLEVAIINSGLSAYPVGSIYMSVNATNPKNLFGGTWEQLKNAFLFATNSTSGAKGTGSGTGTSTGSAGTGATGSWSGTSGGTALTVAQLPSHGHAQNYSGGGSGDTNRAITRSTGGSTAGDNIHGTYQGCYMPSHAGWSNTYYTIIGTGRTGGDSAHTHSLPGHTHTGPSHSHTVPYLEVYVWKRTA